jgi:hypothetical protein
VPVQQDGTGSAGRDQIVERGLKAARSMR